MDATTGMAVMNIAVDVKFTAAGAPLAVRYDGRVWSVATEPFHWFTRNNWWESGQRAPQGAGEDLVSVEYWRVQVRLTSASSLRTFTLRREPRGSHWVLESVTNEGMAAA